MTDRIASQYMDRVNHFVANMTYHSDVASNGKVKAEITPAPLAANATGLLSAQSINSAGSTSTFVTNDTTTPNMRTSLALFGRSLQFVASAASTSTVTVIGRDYLGQPMKEQVTLNGTTVVQGVKAFAKVEQVSWTATAAVTMNVGWGNKLGLPFRALALDVELVAGFVPGNAGALVAGADPAVAQTATSADPRGTYAPHASFVPDGSRVYAIVYQTDKTNLLGAKHFLQ